VSFDVHELDAFLLVGAGVTLLAILAVRVSTRFGMPSLLLYLLIGVLLGDSGLLHIEFDDAQLARALSFLALALILVEGGLTTYWPSVRPVIGLSAMLATVGLVLSVAVMAVASHLLLGLSWELAILLGAITSSTDAAAVFSVLRALPLPRRISGILEGESGLNDAPSVVLVVVVSTGAAQVHSPAWAVGDTLYQLGLGVLSGLVVGFGGAWVMRRVALPSSGLYPLAVLCFAFLGYGAAALAHASGFAAIFVAGVVLGNQELPHRSATRSFAEGTAWLAQIGLFVMLGLLASPQRFTWTTVGIALAAGTILTFVARPLSVWVATLPWSLPRSEVAFLSWAGLRGAVPIVLATIPLSEGVHGAQRLFDVVFVLVVVFTLLTGPTLPRVARVLRVARRSEPRELDIEAAPLERIAADLLQVTISPRSQMHGVEVGELRLPRGASVSMVIRGGETLVPEQRTVLRHGDDLLVVTPRRLRFKTEERLRQVSLRGRLAQWLAD
jgi:cell volume regulation protein A